MYSPLILLSKFFLISLVTMVELPSVFELESSNYNNMQISSFASEKNNETNQYEYDVQGQNIGEQYMLLSQTRMTIDDVEHAPTSNGDPFFCREVVKPNDYFSLDYEMTGNYEQSQIEMSSISYGPIDEFVEFVEDVSSEYSSSNSEASLHTPKMSNLDFRKYDFVFKFNGLEPFPERWAKHYYYLIIDLTYEETDYCIIADTSSINENESYLNVEIITNYEINPDQIEFNNVKAISIYEMSFLNALGLFATGLFLIRIVLFTFYGTIAIALISTIVLITIFIVKKTKFKRKNKMKI